MPTQRLANPFKPAELVEPKVKAALFGGPGVGKTWYGLAVPGKLAVIDTEGGTAHYAGREGLSEFDVLPTKTYAEVRSAVAYLAANPSEYAGLVIDPVTVIYEVLQDAAQIKRAARTGDYDADLDQLAWGRIKRFYKALMTDIVNLPMHVIVTARERDIFEGKGDDRRKIGVGLDAEKGTSYYFDTVLRLTAGKGWRKAEVIKDRTGTLELGAELANPTFVSVFGDYLAGKGKAQRHVQGDDDAAAADAAAMPGGKAEAIAGPRLAAAVVEALEAIEQDPDAIRSAQFGELPWSEAPKAKVEQILDRAEKALAKANAAAQAEAAQGAAELAAAADDEPAPDPTKTVVTDGSDAAEAEVAEPTPITRGRRAAASK